MRKLSVKIFLGYFLLTIVFYAIAFIIRGNEVTEPTSELQGFGNAIMGSFYWAITFICFLITVGATALIGFIYNFVKKNKEGLVVFGIIFLLSIILMLVMTLNG